MQLPAPASRSACCAPAAQSYCLSSRDSDCIDHNSCGATTLAADGCCHMTVGFSLSSEPDANNLIAFVFMWLSSSTLCLNESTCMTHYRLQLPFADGVNLHSMEGLPCFNILTVSHLLHHLCLSANAPELTAGTSCTISPTNPLIVPNLRLALTVMVVATTADDLEGTKGSSSILPCSQDE